MLPGSINVFHSFDQEKNTTKLVSWVLTCKACVCMNQHKSFLTHINISFATQWKVPEYRVSTMQVNTNSSTIFGSITWEKNISHSYNTLRNDLAYHTQTHKLKWICRMVWQKDQDSEKAASRIGQACMSPSTRGNGQLGWPQCTNFQFS